MSRMAEPIPKAKPKRKTSSLKACDSLFGKIVRFTGRCVECGSTEVIQCAHGFSRRYRAVRWDERNAFPLCRAHHLFFTHRPLEWDAWLRDRWGNLLYEELRNLALYGRNPDLKATEARLRDRLARIEGRAA